MKTTMTSISLFVLLALSAQVLSSPLWGPVFVYQRPLDAMVDITNDLGIAVLQDHVSSRSNFAFSPYGVASVLVLLYEGSRGESARQIHNALRFPWQRDVTRIGFRDIHRHLRTYFSHEGYLSGITLSKTNTSLLPEYQRVLRFYGYDVSLGNPMKPRPSSNDEMPPSVTSENSTQSTTETSDTTTDSGQSTTDMSGMTTGSTDSSVMTTDEIGTTSNPNETLREMPEMSTTMDETTTLLVQNVIDDSEMSTKGTDLMSSLMMSDEKLTESPVVMVINSTESPENNTQMPDVTEKSQEDLGSSAKPTTGNPIMEIVENTEGTTEVIKVTDSKPFPETTSTSEAAPTQESASDMNSFVTDSFDSTSKTTFTSITPQMDESTTHMSETLNTVTNLPKTTTRSMAEVTERMTTLQDKIVTTNKSTPDMEESTMISEDVSLVPGSESSSEIPLVTSPQEPTEFPEELTTTSTAKTFTSTAEIESTTNFEDLQTTSTDSATDIPATELGEENSSVESREMSTVVSVQETTAKDISSTLIPTDSTNRGTESSTTTGINKEVSSDVETTLAPQMTNEEDNMKRKNDKLRPILKNLGDTGEQAESRVDAEDSTMPTTDSAPVDSEGTTLEEGNTATPETEDGESSTIVPNADVEENVTSESSTIVPNADVEENVTSESSTIVPNADVEENVTSEGETTEVNEELNKPAAIQVETLVATSSANNTDGEPLDRRKRAIRDPAGLAYPDISLQLQNGMYGSHVSRGDALFTQLPRFPFLVDGVTDELVPVMSYTSTFPFAFIPRLHSLALEFPLDDDRYKLLIILPVERRGLKQLIYDLSSCPLREVYESLKPTRVNAVIPSFMVEGFVILTSTLQQLGIWDVFDPRRSDLSGMSSDPELYVRNIEQSITVVIRNYVEIVDIQTRTMAARSQIERFEATHPFLYFVMDSETHVSLMAGKIIDPLNSRIY